MTEGKGRKKKSHRCEWMQTHLHAHTPNTKLLIPSNHETWLHWFQAKTRPRICTGILVNICTEHSITHKLKWVSSWKPVFTVKAWVLNSEKENYYKSSKTPSLHCVLKVILVFLRMCTINFEYMGLAISWRGIPKEPSPTRKESCKRHSQ